MSAARPPGRPREGARAPRRAVLRAGALGSLGITLGDALRRRAGAAGPPPRARSVILVWASGGISHHDSFDPKPERPPEVRGEFATISTAVPGVRFSELVPALARGLDRLALVRSLTHAEGDHGVATYYMLRGYAQPSPLFDRPENQENTHPNIGSIVARELPPRGVLPPYVCAPGLSYVAQVRYFTPGWLGPAFAPLLLRSDPQSPHFEVRDLFPPAGQSPARAARRSALLDAVDRAVRAHESAGGADGRDAAYRKAFSLLASPAARAAFRLEAEPPALRDRYGRTTVGQSCLLARRLVEAGVPFVTVDDDGWDHHGRIFPALRNQLPALDRAVAALVADLADRGLLEETLVLLMTDFGRTPRVNAQAGRDHWPSVFSILLAGAGIPGGLVIGSSDADGAEPGARPVTPKDLARTVYHFLGIDCRREYLTPQGQPVPYLDGGEVIPELL